MKQVNIGIRITEEGLAFFGTEEVNELIVRGYRVTRVDPGNAIVEEVAPEESGEEEEVLTLAGCDMVVELTEPDG